MGQRGIGHRWASKVIPLGGLCWSFSTSPIPILSLHFDRDLSERPIAFPFKMSSTLRCALLGLLAVACAIFMNLGALADPDLPGHVSPSETLDAYSLFIPMDRTWQASGLKTTSYAPNNGSGLKGGAFNLRAYNEYPLPCPSASCPSDI